MKRLKPYLIVLFSVLFNLLFGGSLGAPTQIGKKTLDWCIWCQTASQNGFIINLLYNNDCTNLIMK